MLLVVRVLVFYFDLFLQIPEFLYLYYASLEKHRKALGFGVVEIGFGTLAFRLDYDLVVEDCCLLRTLCRAKVNLFTVYHDEYLPRLAILGDTSIERASVTITEPPVVDLASTSQNDFVHTEWMVRVRQVCEHLQPIALLPWRVVTFYRRIKNIGYL